VRTLRGGIGRNYHDRPLHGKAREQAEFGALAFRSQTSVGHLIDRLLHNGFLQERKLENGGIVIELAPEGKAAMQHPAKLDGLLTPTLSDKSPHLSEHAPKPAPPKAQGELDNVEVDTALLAKLREWRRAQARRDRVAPFMVFHDRHLQAIASRRPTTLEMLSQVKGVGEVRLAKYGQRLIELVCAHLGGIE
jgi:ATP-dependent DNA helicase RecQ